MFHTGKQCFPVYTDTEFYSDLYYLNGKLAIAFTTREIYIWKK